jgi:hypothetical protein
MLEEFIGAAIFVVKIGIRRIVSDKVRASRFCDEWNSRSYCLDKRSIDLLVRVESPGGEIIHPCCKLLIIGALGSKT